ncbi:Wzz/FepE/Etk N-terminal domain-containing protein [Marinobacter sp. BGYM27]|uniref:Wzz/FepE/Etk N-terminal domain-containing protein n=1 Tax=Marinobacter sp. BGYM27 TaxID=2975597 RepID=UPI0021A6582A|nr:Wzz/FepE/Etk N-terminal domain-containing protein [Marinobacter sp. BGYM27]MDG5499552.1 Wzz/FepE/Etk N-terminal domain-containing protein [Marinobacter sp. BGYM27]
MSEQEAGAHPPHPSYANDEISLVDIAKVLIRRKAWIISLFLICLLGSVGLALVKDSHYTYTTSILVGEFGLDKYVSSAKQAKSVLDSRIVPVIERQFVDKRDIEQIPFETSVMADEGNNFVTLQSKATEDKRSLVAEFHESMASALTRDHNEKLSLLEKESDMRLQALHVSYETEQRQLEELRKLLATSTESVDKAEAEEQVRANSQGASGNMEATLTSSNNKLTFMLSQMQLTQQLSERENRVNELQSDINEEELKRSWIKPTRTANLATASIRPSGTGKALIVALGAMLGVMLGVFAAFFAEFVSRVRQVSE